MQKLNDLLLDNLLPDSLIGGASREQRIKHGCGLNLEEVSDQLVVTVGTSFIGRNRLNEAFAEVLRRLRPSFPLRQRSTSMPIW